MTNWMYTLAIACNGIFCKEWATPKNVDIYKLLHVLFPQLLIHTLQPDNLLIHVTEIFLDHFFVLILQKIFAVILNLY